MALNNLFAPIAPFQDANFRSSALSALAPGGFDATNPVSSARYPLSLASFSNEPILVPGTSVSSEIHLCDASAVDEVFLWCGNFSSANSILYLGIGGTSDYQTISIEIPKNSGLVQVYPGIPHLGISIYARSSVADSLNMIGFVTRKYLNVTGEKQYGYDSSE